MSAGKYKLKVEQGTDLQKWFRKTVDGVPADFTGYTDGKSYGRKDRVGS